MKLYDFNIVGAEHPQFFPTVLNVQKLRVLKHP